LLYDYYGFPPESYQLKYDAPGSPEVAKEVEKALKDFGLHSVMNEERGENPYIPAFYTRCAFPPSPPCPRQQCRTRGLTPRIPRVGSWRLRPHAPHQPLRRYSANPALRPLF
jgi:hypothetical protein